MCELTSAGGRPAQVRLLPATTRSSTKVVNRNAAAFWDVFVCSDDDGDSRLCAEYELTLKLKPAFPLSLCCVSIVCFDSLYNFCYHSVQNLLSSSLLTKNLKIKIYRTIILPVVLYGCETWSLTLREEHRLRVFENRVLRGIFGAKRDEVTGEWRKLHNEELNDLYSSPNIVRVIKSRRLRWAGHVARMEEGRGVLKVLVGKPVRKSPLGRPRRRWEDNIKMDLEEVEGVVGTGWSWLRIGTGGGRL